jgi:hypothetical protein
MNKDLSEKAVDILLAIQTGVEKSVGFAQEQLPDLAQQYILFGRVNETLTVGLLVIAALMFSVFSVRNWKAKSFEEHNAFLMATCAFSAIIMSLVAASHLSDLLMVWFAPKIWIITQIKSLIS